MDRTLRVRLAAGVVGLGFLAAACSSSDDDNGDEQASSDTTAAAAAEDQVFPGAEWERADPTEMGFDPATLDELAAEAEANESNCLLVLRQGKIVYERYWNGTDADSAQEIFSATKSFTSTLVGIAQDEGHLDIDDPASDHIPEWAGTDSEAVTVKNLVSNDSGRHWETVVADIADLTGQPDRTGYAIGLGQDLPPGTVWNYNNAAIQTLDAVIEDATGTPTHEYAQEMLFEPIGMTDTEMTTDGAGNTNTYFGMQSTCEDMARFGYLFLRDGNWDGEQVVSAEWVEEATGQPSTELSAQYGYLWWLNREGPQAGLGTSTPTSEPVADGKAVPDAPDDMYWAQGLGGQTIQVDPGSDTVVVRLGSGDVQADYGSSDTARVVTEALVD